jgi:ferredoxin
MKVAVVGSGPSGWIVAQKLIDLGHNVTIFDPALNGDSAVSSLKAVNKKLLAGKLLHGSDFPFRAFPHGPAMKEEGSKTLTSNAQGGLSLVWGATMLPYCEADIKSWPIDFIQLKSGYEYVSQKIPLSSRKDALSEKYVNFSSQEPLLASPRIDKIINKLSSTSSPDVLIGYSRLAVKVTTLKSQGCFYCGQCLTGCPSDFIWHAPRIGLSELVGYVENRVISIKETSDGVSITSVDLDGKVEESGPFDRLFLGAGPIESFRILATSNLVSKTAVMKDSATFFIPILLSKSFDLPPEKAFTLSQAFMRIEAGILPAAQIQLYEYSEDLIGRARKTLPFGQFIPSFVLRSVLQRMVVGIGYLDSEASTTMKISLEDNQDVRISADNLSIARHRKRAKPYIQRFSKVSKQFGITPLFILTKFSRPGEGVHYGSWLPMGIGADLLGRPMGVERIHVIDSSVLPSIPAGAITFSIMANAVRIIDEMVETKNL